MNKKQWQVILGLAAYSIGGAIVVFFNLETFIQIVRTQPYLLKSVIKTYSIILTVGLILIYLLRDKRKAA